MDDTDRVLLDAARDAGRRGVIPADALRRAGISDESAWGAAWRLVAARLAWWRNPRRPRTLVAARRSALGAHREPRVTDQLTLVALDDEGGR